MTQAMLGDVAVTRLVLGRGGEPTAVDNSGSTALLQAARGGHAEVVDLYLAQPTVAVRHIFCFCFCFWWKLLLTLTFRRGWVEQPTSVALYEAAGLLYKKKC